MKKAQNFTKKKLKAFSLIELSIVILIISILLTGTISISNSSINNKKIAQTKEKMAAIYKAMGIYLAKNGKLPCPAKINLTKSNSDYGVAVTSCNTTPAANQGYWRTAETNMGDDFDIFYGMVPTTTLNLPMEYAEDAFGTKLSYFILSGFTQENYFGTGINTLKTYIHEISGTTPPRLTIKDDDQNVNEDAMFVIVSHGANKLGGWNSNSTTQNTLSTDIAEARNQISYLDYYYDGRANMSEILSFSNNNSEEFDDIIFYKTRDEMTYDFNLLGLVHCDEDTSQSITYGSSYSFTWDVSALSNPARYGEIVASNSGSTCASASYNAGVARPTKKCGAFGKWEADVIENCLQ